jgi:hypothetical protein
MGEKYSSETLAPVLVLGKSGSLKSELRKRTVCL